MANGDEDDAEDLGWGVTAEWSRSNVVIDDGIYAARIPAAVLPSLIRRLQELLDETDPHESESGTDA